MQFRESAGMALGALRTNKLRSFLTLLGTIVGVTAVITIVSLIQGMNAYVSSKLLAQGANQPRGHVHRRLVPLQAEGDVANLFDGDVRIGERHQRMQGAHGAHVWADR